MKKGNILNYKKIIIKVFLNNYAFLTDVEFRSSYVCELVNFYNEDNYFIDILWRKIRRTNLDNFYNFDFLINNLYFLLKRNNTLDFKNKLVNLIKRKLDKTTYTFNESKSIFSLISLIVDLNLNVSIEKIINQFLNKFPNTNLDLSAIERFYPSLFSKINKKIIHSIEYSFDDFDDFIEILSNTFLFYRNIPFIIDKFNNDYFDRTLDLLNDEKISFELRNNILYLVSYTRKRPRHILYKLLNSIGKFTDEQKTVVYYILAESNSKKMLSIISSKFKKKYLQINALLDNYSVDNYELIHNKISKLKINYSNSNNWFEVESNLIRYFNKKSTDDRLLVDLKVFFKNGLSSYNRYNIARILERNNMLDDTERENLKYDANCKIRAYFSKNE